MQVIWNTRKTRTAQTTTVLCLYHLSILKWYYRECQDLILRVKTDLSHAHKNLNPVSCFCVHLHPTHFGNKTSLLQRLTPPKSVRDYQRKGVRNLRKPSRGGRIKSSYWKQLRNSLHQRFAQLTTPSNSGSNKEWLILGTRLVYTLYRWGY